MFNVKSTLLQSGEAYAFQALEQAFKSYITGTRRAAMQHPPL